MKNLTNDPTPVALSISLYEMLLAAYPSGFRHEYGPHMAQVFRDYCLRSYRQRGYPGMLNLWILTLIDYLKTVFEEHVQRGIHMSKLTFIRLSGLAFVLGALAFVVVMTGLLRNVPEYNPNNYFSNPIDLYFEYAFTFLLPAAVFLWMVGMLGLYSRYKDEISGFGRFATLTGIIGGAISFLVTLTWSLQISFTEGEVDWWLFITGISLYFLALVVFGVASLRERLLPRWNALPIIASSWLLIVWLSSIFNLGDGILSDSIMLGLTLLSMLSLAALGVTLRSDAQEEIALA